MKHFLLALQFLTTVGLQKNQHYEPGDFSSSLRWFPWIGFLIGALQWCVARLLVTSKVPEDFSSLILLVVNLFITGGIHLDGFADSVDGFGAGRDRESILRIMKDARLGVFAVAGIFVILYAKVLAFGFVIQSGKLPALVIAPILSRTMLVLSCTLLPYARQEGTGKAFSSPGWFRNSLPAFAGCIVLIFFVGGRGGLCVTAIATGVCLLFSLYSYRKIHGFTGDTLGFLNELADITSLLAFPLLTKAN
jgi:adenosylcobinamide-GDP ribazoletransferase